MAAKRVIRKKTVENASIKLAVVGGDTYNIDLNDHPTLGAVLKEAMPKNWKRDTADVRINGATAADDQRLADKDIISVVPRVVGG